MSRREQWRKVLELELTRWAEKPYAQLKADLIEDQTYEVMFEEKAYQVEVTLVEDKDDHIHVVLSVDDGSVPASFWPESRSFIRKASLE
ncbi:MAG TPA: hypothetical protein VFO39_14105 [Candidatus Sulfotelmatobacter sp.]|nr:hypothetical protein [Candidatus Sulfotelmatobacter sp.]